MTRDTRDLFDDRSNRGRFGDNELRGNDSVRSDLKDLSMVLHHETEKAILVSDDGYEGNAVWLPKSRCEFERTGHTITGTRKSGQTVTLPALTVTLPEPFAAEKGLL